MNSSFCALAVGGFSVVAWDIDGPAVDEQLADVRWLRDLPPSLALDLDSSRSVAATPAPSSDLGVTQQG